jgi:hypothetical protein
MAFNLSAYPAIETALFVRIDVPDFEVLRFSNFNRPYTINSESYTALGTLLSISDSQSELRTTPGELSIVISGIPNTTIGNFLDQKIRGSSVQAYRVLFDTDSQALAITGNPTGRFQGIVNNFSIEEEFDSASAAASSTILITCTSTVELLSNKISGRRTNPIDQKALYPTDLSMDRVIKLSKANLNWGAPV